MIYLELFISYLKIGFFGFGGGYSMLSLIQHEVVVQNQWISSATLSDIIAISQMTPGPIAINSATYIGYTVAGFWGSVIATVAVSLPSLSIMVLITHFIMRLKESTFMECFMTAMRPAVIAMIAAASAMLLFPEDKNAASMIDVWSWVIFAAAFVASLYRFNPIKLMALSAVAGISIYYIPTLVASPADQVQQVEQTTWEGYDLSDLEVLESSEFQQKWVDYLYKLQSYNPIYASKLIKAQFELTTSNPEAINSLFDFTEKYLYDANSPIRSEELFIPVLEFMTQTQALDPIYQLRPKSLLEIVKLNRVGEVANDFYIKGTSTMHQIESPYTLLYFFDPDCSDCKRVSGVIESSDLLKKIQADGKLHLARVKVIGNKQIDTLYDLKAMPTLYLLDKEKRVLLKDESIETILESLNTLKN